MIQSFKRALSSLCLLWCSGLAATYARADVGLIVETPTGMLGFLSDVGHASVWISHGCLNKEGEVRYCEHSSGIVLSSTAYWSTPGAAAIPAELFFLGAAPGKAGRSLTAWTSSLGAAYPTVNPSYGRKYLGRVWCRGMRVTTFATTPEEDRRVLEQVERQRQEYRYSYSRRNCSFYAQQVLQLYLGTRFHANLIFDVGINTPRALERALLHRLEADPGISFRVFTFHGRPSQSWRQPPRNLCEAALFDPKYAVPLLMFQPYIYVGFGACYGATRVAAFTWNKRQLSSSQTSLSPFAFSDRIGTDARLLTYQQLTGGRPVGSGWSLATVVSAPAPPEQAQTEQILASCTPKRQDISASKPGCEQHDSSETNSSGATTRLP